MSYLRWVYTFCNWLTEIKPDKKDICPACGTPLIKGPEKRYETLLEHVSCTDGEEEYPLRPTLVCINPSCNLEGKGFWSIPPDGDWYSDHVNPIDVYSLSSSFSLTNEERLHFVNGKYCSRLPLSRRVFIIWWNLKLFVSWLILRIFANPFIIRKFTRSP